MSAPAFDWTAVAASWDRHRDHVSQSNAPLTQELLDRLDLGAGERVLELGAGTGELSEHLAELVGPRGRVHASDVAPGMVALLRRTLADLPTVEVSQLDARDTGLPDACVDAVVFRMGLMFVDDPAAALRECRRVLVATGRIGLAVWAGPEHNPWLASVGMSAMMHGVFAGGPPVAPGGVFSLGDPALLESLVSAAGFTDVKVQPVESPATFADADEHFDVVSSLAGPMATAFAAVDGQALAAVRETTAGAVARFVTEKGLVLPGRALVATAHA